MLFYHVKEYIDLLEEKELLIGTNVLEIEQEVKGITYDSKKVKRGTLFICKGTGFKAEYLSEAKELGAFVYLSEHSYENIKLPHILVKDIRKAMAFLGKKFYQDPTRKLKVIGITGTKGKSTTAYFLKGILDSYEKSRGRGETGLISTIETYDGNKKVQSSITTPESLTLQEHCFHAYENQLEFMNIEVSSQGFKYHRVLGCKFDTGIFLNISEDHISPIEHPDFEDYFSSKLEIFSQSKKGIINRDCEEYERILQAAKTCKEIITFGCHKESDVRIEEVKVEGEFTRFWISYQGQRMEFAMKMKGRFNVENAVAAITCGLSYGIPAAFLKEGILNTKIKGRMECFVSKDKNVVAVVDYAHNKISFQKMYETIKETYPEYRIVSIFGCPGGKAYNRRSQLGDVAGRFSDFIYLVADDPGEESYIAIAKEIAKAVEHHHYNYVFVESRQEAIQEAIEQAQEKTVVFIAGKGHETIQKYGRTNISIPSDMDCAKQSLFEYNLGDSFLSCNAACPSFGSI